MKFVFTALLLIAAYNVAYGWSDPFNQEEGKCGCCPLPCCCKCIEKEEPAPVQPECPSAEPPIVECKQLLNFGFIVDVSASIQPANLPKVKVFLKHVVNSMSGGGSKNAMVSYALNATEEWGFNDPAGTDPVLASAIIDQLTLGYYTNMVEAMELMIDVVDRSSLDPTVPKVFILFADGRSEARTPELPFFSEELKKLGLVAVVGVTDFINPSQLEGVATSGTFTYVDDFDGLQDILNDVIMEVCDVIEVPTPAPCPTLPPVKVEDECFCCCPPPFPTGPLGYCSK